MSCHSEACQAHSSHHSHEGNCGQSCGQSCNCKCCGGHQSCCCCCQGKQDCKSMSHDFLHLADKAWMELLMERIKEEIRVADGQNIDELAKAICAYNRSRWHAKLTEKTSSEEYEEKIKQMMTTRHHHGHGQVGGNQSSANKLGNGGATPSLQRPL